jgi:broad specificity phosphatase PhoE
LFALFQLGTLCLGQPAVVTGTTVFVVRHAEKADSSSDSDLSEAGTRRAIRLAELLGEAGIVGLYATQYKRTEQTLRPLADRLGLDIDRIDAAMTSELVAQILSRFPGERVAVASHSDRVTEIVEALGGKSVGYLEESEYDNLFVVTVLAPSRAEVVRLKF